MTQQWFLITYGKGYKGATKRFEKINTFWDIPELDPIELIKVRMEDFGYKPSDFANEYGDKGTISKVLNYKQLLSLTMIRKFSKMLRLPSDALTKEYLTT